MNSQKFKTQDTLKKDNFVIERFVKPTNEAEPLHIVLGTLLRTEQKTFFLIFLHFLVVFKLWYVTRITRVNAAIKQQRQNREATF